MSLLLNNSGITQTSKFQNNNNPFSFLKDPTAVLMSDKRSIGCWGERNYLLKDLSHFILALNYPDRLGNMSMAVDYFGGVNYNESTFLFDYAHHLNDKSSIGILFQSQLVKLVQHQKELRLGAVLGGNFMLSEKLSTSICLNNYLYNSTFSDFTSLSKTDFWCNLDYNVTNSFYFSSTLLKQNNQTPNLILGFMYHFRKKIFIKYGFSSGINQMYASVGFALNNMRLEITNSFHPKLGITPSLSIVTNKSQ